MQRNASTHASLPARYFHRILPATPLSFKQLELATHVRQLIKKGRIQFVAQPCLCKSKHDLLLAAYDRFNLPSQTVLCMDCGLVRVDPRMDEASLHLFYTQYYQPLYQGEESFDALFAAQKSHGAFISHFIGNILKPDSLVLEFGAGPGGILCEFKERGYATAGVDLDPQAVQWAQKKHKLDLSAGGVDKLSQFKGKADLVILSHVLEHMPEPSQILKDLHDLLRPSGFLYIEVPGIRSLSTGQQEMCGGLAAHPHNKDFLEYLRSVHLWSFDRKTLDAVVVPNGFKAVKGDELVRVLYQKELLPIMATPWPQNYGKDILSFLMSLEKDRKTYDRQHWLRDSSFWMRTLASWTRRWIGQQLRTARKKDS